MAKVVDLRSDTVTKPTESMRKAMFEAEVDDDVLGRDPTAEKLQETVAAIFGKEAGLFVPSGTMGNLISVLVHCEIRGSEVILGTESHIHHYEQGGISSLGGVHPRTVENKADGTMDLQEVEACIREYDDHFPVTRLICMENTHNRCGGRAVSAEYTDDLASLARKYNLKLHVDGARIFNAATALKVSPARLVQGADSVSVCLSKGLASPLGTVIVGSHEFIHKARRLRKALGGGMRQIGVVASAGLISVTAMVDRLEEDHKNARILAEGISRIEGLVVNVETVDTNLIYINLVGGHFPDAQSVVDVLKKRYNILSLTEAKQVVRLVTHYHISGEDVEYTIASFKELFATT